MAYPRAPRCFLGAPPLRLLSRSGLLLAGSGLLLALLSGCAPERSDAPLRSPTRDYPHPPVTTSDGKVVGADNKPPEDWMAERATSGGLAPGWSGTERGLVHDPAHRGAGAISQPSPPSSARPVDRCRPAGEPRPGAPPRLRRDDDADQGCVDSR